jgi:hypothetical protein
VGLFLPQPAERAAVEKFLNPVFCGVVDPHITQTVGEPMKSLCTGRNLRILLCVSLLACGGSGVATAAAAATVQEAAEHVQAALQSDPYFYGAHVTVSVEGDSVVLNGFVFSDWDLRDAVRIARGAAGGRRVIDNLSIKVGGRR